MPVLFHSETPTTVPTGERAPESILEGFSVGDRVGNPLYMVIDEHALAATLLMVAPLVIWLVGKLIRILASRERAWAVSVVDAYDAAGLRRRAAAWAIWVSALLHGALVFGHELSWYTAAYAVGAGALAVAAVSTIRSEHGRLVATVVVGSIVTFWFLGAPADQLGIATKLLELFAISLLIVPSPDDGWLRRLQPAGLVTLTVLTGLAAWIGAFGTAGADGGHHGGEYPEPGTVVPYIERLEASPDELHYSEDYWCGCPVVKIYGCVHMYPAIIACQANGYCFNIHHHNIGRGGWLYSQFALLFVIIPWLKVTHWEVLWFRRSNLERMAGGDM